jgi:hypothetical protein
VFVFSSGKTITGFAVLAVLAVKDSYIRSIPRTGDGFGGVRAGVFSRTRLVRTGEITRRVRYEIEQLTKFFPLSSNIEFRSTHQDILLVLLLNLVSNKLLLQVFLLD